MEQAIEETKSMADEFGYPELARAALAFVLEEESWPVFLDWIRRTPHSELAHEWSETATLAGCRSLWMSNSPDENIRGLAHA